MKITRLFKFFIVIFSFAAHLSGCEPEDRKQNVKKAKADYVEALWEQKIADMRYCRVLSDRSAERDDKISAANKVVLEADQKSEKAWKNVQRALFGDKKTPMVGIIDLGDILNEAQSEVEKRHYALILSR